MKLGAESAEAFARNRLGDLWDEEPLMVLNDEGHHAYRPAPVGEDVKLTAEEKADREEATVWVSGLDKINAACGIGVCVDMSATHLRKGECSCIAKAPGSEGGLLKIRFYPRLFASLAFLKNFLVRWNKSAQPYSHQGLLRTELRRLLGDLVALRREHPDGSNEECMCMDAITELISKLDLDDFRTLRIEHIVDETDT